jgi:hypothetical protein
MNIGIKSLNDNVLYNSFIDDVIFIDEWFFCSQQIQINVDNDTIVWDFSDFNGLINIELRNMMFVPLDYININDIDVNLTRNISINFDKLLCPVINYDESDVVYGSPSTSNISTFNLDEINNTLTFNVNDVVVTGLNIIHISKTNNINTINGYLIIMIIDSFQGVKYEFNSYILTESVTITNSNKDKCFNLGINQVLNGNGKYIYINAISNFEGLVTGLDTLHDKTNNKNPPVIKNIKMRIQNNSTLKSGSGWIIGDSQRCFTIINCSSDGPISQNSGGICGKNAGKEGDCFIFDCYSEGSIGINAGGICGENTSCNLGSCIIKNCYSEGSVDINAGGICGGNTGIDDGSCIIHCCRSKGDINESAGGICGVNTNNCEINKCYSTGNIYTYGGGITGENTSNSVISTCYSTGDIENQSGGICGKNTSGSTTNYGTYTIIDCYSSGNINGGGGGICGHNTKNNCIIKNTYSYYGMSDSLSTYTSMYGNLSLLHGNMNNSLLLSNALNNNYWNVVTDEMPILKSFTIYPWDNLSYMTNDNNAQLNIGSVVYTNICFRSDTPINTDQGIVKIMDLDPVIHTINGNQIIYVTRTLSYDKTIICIKKNSIELNVPDNNLYVSRNHKILFNGKLLPSYMLTNILDDVIEVPYNGEYLYNIIMTTHQLIEINNLCVETLHPSHYKTYVLMEMINDMDGDEFYDNETTSLIYKLALDLKRSKNTNDNKIYKQLISKINN